MTTVSRERAERERLLAELEWRRCARDFEYFVETYVTIAVQTEDGADTGRAPFELYDYQRDWVRDGYLARKMLVFLKVRQVGATTLAMAYGLWLLMFRRGGATVTIISKDDNAAASNLVMLGAMYRFLPDWMKDRGPKQTGFAKTSLEWKHADGSVSLATSHPATDRTGAGTTPTFVVLDEADLYQCTGGFASVWSVVEPATMAAVANTSSPRAVVAVISTARNPSGLFASFYWNAKRGANRFKAFFTPWTSNRLMWTAGKPDRSKLEEKRRDLADVGKEHEFYRDYPETDEQAFALSGRRWFETIPDEDDCPEFELRGELRRSVFDHNAGELYFHPTEHGVLRVVEDGRPDPARKHVLVIDPAHGRGGDYTAAQVWRWDADGDPECVAYWTANNIEQHDWAPKLAELGRWYAGGGWDEALLVIETTGGHAELPLTVFKATGYRNLYTHVPVNKRRRRPNAQPGFNTAGTGGLRGLALAKAQELLPRATGIYPMLRAELSTFVVHDNGFVAADKGLHDDQVMAAAIGLYVLAERVPAGVVSTGEQQPQPAPQAQTGSVAHIWAEADRIRRSEEDRFRRQMRRAAATQRRADRRRR